MLPKTLPLPHYCCLVDYWRICLVVRLRTPSDRYTPVPCSQLIHSHRCHLFSAVALILPPEADQSRNRTVPPLRSVTSTQRRSSGAWFPSWKGSVTGAFVYKPGCAHLQHSLVIVYSLVCRVYCKWQEQQHPCMYLSSHFDKAKHTHWFKWRSWSDEIQYQLMSISLHSGRNVPTHLGKTRNITRHSTGSAYHTVICSHFLPLYMF